MIRPQELAARLGEAQRRLDAGDATGTARLCEDMLRTDPKLVGAHVLLGRALLFLGQADRGLAELRSAAELAPQDAGRWAEFVSALLKAGQKGRARKVAQKAPLKGSEKKKLLDLARNPNARAGLDAGGVARNDVQALQDMLQQGRADGARKLAGQLLQRHPASPLLYNISGAASMMSGDFERAEAAFRKTLDLAPDFAGAAGNLGLALIRQGKHGLAVAVLERAVALDPGAPEIRKNLALAYLESRDFNAAAEQAQALLDAAGDEPDGLRLLATALKELRRYDEALSTIDRLVQAAGQSEATHVLRFEVLAEAGRIDAAKAYAEPYLVVFPGLNAEYARLSAQLGDVDGARTRMAAMIDTDPTDLMGYYRYGLYTRWNKDDPHLAGLRDAVGRADPGVPGEIAGLYALAKAEFDLGADAEGIVALDKANALQGRSVTYDFDAAEARRRDIESRWDAEAIQMLSGAGDESVAPIFIVGAPRSGSTLIEQIIAAHPVVASIGEDSFTQPFFPLDLPAEKDALAAAARKGAAEIRRLAGSKTRLLDKYLHNFWRLGSLAAAFPNATFVEVRRDPRAIAWSIYSNYMTEGHAYATDLEDIAEFYLNLHAFMGHWHTTLGDRILVAEYERFTRDPETEIRVLIDALGLPWNEACLHPEAARSRVKSLSVAQVRTGIHAGSIERWKRYEEHLAPFTKILSDAGIL